MYLYIRLGPQGIRAVPAPPCCQGPAWDPLKPLPPSLDTSHVSPEHQLSFKKFHKTKSKAKVQVPKESHFPQSRQNWVLDWTVSLIDDILSFILKEVARF